MKGQKHKKRFQHSNIRFQFSFTYFSEQKRALPMILPLKNSTETEFYIFSSAFTPLNLTQVAKSSLMQLRGRPSQEKNFQDELSDQYTEKQHDSLKNQVILSTQGSQIFTSKQFQKSSISIQEQDIKNEAIRKQTFDERGMKLDYHQPSSRLRVKKPFKYDFDSQPELEEKQFKKCQTKNIIKNFIRSVLSFLRKNQKYQNKLVCQLKIDPQQFQEYLEMIQGKINTINQLRQFWTQGKYHQACRIISSHFLRKYYPKHIFNSRIFNHKIHLKYRIKLLKSLQKPEEFTSLKQF